MSAHGKNHWIKLYVEIIDDPKVGLLPVNAKWRFVSCLALAGELNEGGFLPPVDDLLAYRLRADIDTINAEMRLLSNRELAELRKHPDGSERWFMTNFEKRQEPVSNTERQRQWRKRNADRNDGHNGHVTKSYGSVTKKQNTETETETEEEAREDATPTTSSSFELLQAHFAKRKAIYPNDRTGTYERDWKAPLEEFLAKAGGDAVKAAGYIDAALEVAAGSNEQGKTYTVSSPRSLSGIIANLPGESQEGYTPDTIWKRALACLNANKAPDEPRLLAAVSAVGWSALMAADDYTAPRLKSKLFNAYRSAPA